MVKKKIKCEKCNKILKSKYKTLTKFGNFITYRVFYCMDCYKRDYEKFI